MANGEYNFVEIETLVRGAKVIKKAVKNYLCTVSIITIRNRKEFGCFLEEGMFHTTSFGSTLEVSENIYRFVFHK